MLGEADVACRSKGTQFILNLLVNVKHGPLFAEKTCLALGLVKYHFEVETNREMRELGEECRSAWTLLKKLQFCMEFGY